MNIPFFSFNKQYRKELATWDNFISASASETTDPRTFWEYLLDQLLDALNAEIRNEKGKIDFVKMIFAIGKIAAKLQIIISTWKKLKHT